MFGNWNPGAGFLVQAPFWGNPPMVTSYSKENTGEPTDFPMLCTTGDLTRAFVFSTNAITGHALIQIIYFSEQEK